MLRSIRRSLLSHLQATKSPLTPSLLRLLHNPTDPSSFTPSAAAAAAKKVCFNSPEKPSSIVQLLQDRSFSKTQLTNLISKHPRILLVNPEKTIKPKLDFFTDIGYLDSDVAKLISDDPNLLLTSLENTLVPNFDSLKVVFGSAKTVLSAPKSSSRLMRYDLGKMVFPNLEILQNHGMPQPSIVKLATLYP